MTRKQVYQQIAAFTGDWKSARRKAEVFEPMHHKNPDGSIDVLGVTLYRMSSGMSVGSYSREKIQRSLANHADKLKAAGATIIKQTKNKLVARHGRETAYFTITHLRAQSFFKNLEKQ